MVHRTLFFTIGLAMLAGIFLNHPVASAQARTPSGRGPQTTCVLVIYVLPDDPYLPLAEEIAESEGAPLTHSLETALACDPQYLIWVASPDFISQEDMIEFGLAMKARPSAVSSGVITGSTLTRARQLWQRRTQVEAQYVYAVNAANPAAHIYRGRIIPASQAGASIQALTKSTFVQALTHADYLTFTGHGSNAYLRLDEETTLKAPDVPEMDGLVIATGSCQTLRIWNPDSISLTFADRGAAAYSGFVFSPNEGYLLGEFDGLPYLHTWPDFPIGHIIQVQNQGTLRGFAAFPYQHLLGDPRIALDKAAPYTIVADQVEGNTRTLELANVPDGVMPVRIQGGAEYNFVRVPGVGAADRKDPFYNSRLQMVDIGPDKYILLDQEGGELRLRLSRRAPWYWFPLDGLLDSLDHTLIFSQQSGGSAISISIAILPLLWVLAQALRKRIEGRRLLAALIVGGVAAGLDGIYTLIRLERVTITSKAVVFSPLSLLAIFLLTACGALIYMQARGRSGRALGLLVATAISWVPLVFGVGLLAAINLLVFEPEIGVALYNYNLGLLSLGATIASLLLIAPAFMLLGTWARRKRLTEAQPYAI